MARKTKAKRSKFKGKVTANSHKQKSQKTQYGHLNLPKGVNVFKETPGDKVRLDFLPYEVTDPKHPDRDDEREIAIPGELWYKRPYKLHRNIGPNNNESAVCPTSFGKKCPICEYRAKLLQEGADWQDEAVKALKASNRNLYVVVPKGQKDYEEKPHVWDISQFLFQDKLNDEMEEDEDYGVFPDLEEGLTLRIRFSEEKLGKNTFAETSRIDFEERDEQYDEDILKKVPNLDEILSALSYSQLEAKFFELEDEPAPEEDVQETEEEGDELEEKEERPKRKKKEPVKKKTEPEPEEEDEEDERDEEECVACEGTGENSRGKKCRICKGTGVKPKKEKEPEPEPEPPKKQEKKTAKKKGKKSDTPECPYGFNFGTDCEEYDECDECDEFEACLDAKEEMEE